MMNIRRYTHHDQEAWDTLVRNARNATFLFFRQYMDYHSERFTDHSLLFHDSKGNLVAALPANEIYNDNGQGLRMLISHQGLTYGGLIMHTRLHAEAVEEIFALIISYMQQNGFAALRYKPLPHIYHAHPSEEDEYWLWRNGAQLSAVSLSTTVNLRNTSIASKRKQTYCNKLAAQGYTISYNTPLNTFWPLLETNLMSSHGVRPVHTLAEMELLQSRFPDSIVCATVLSPDGTVVAGTVLYITPHVIHTQYISASEEGKQTNAMDFLMLSLIRRFASEGQHDYLDFGISTEHAGTILNSSLCMQKEGYGGRSTLYKEYVMKV
ncbi:MAG: GNAT family N-acetyltransferase [Prevotella sp.]|nr:GNAT family N-acetyltransferase [Prevotella sp.]